MLATNCGQGLELAEGARGVAQGRVRRDWYYLLFIVKASTLLTLAIMPAVLNNIWFTKRDTFTCALRHAYVGT